MMLLIRMLHNRRRTFSPTFAKYFLLTQITAVTFL
ncbi:hypothetical protein CRE_09824 [Caenorhabditis remanei]|uniref:Uncharacterized protein n=1 Tax=Caenorhabditis remanei TaxID=31234 RepID=E3NG51_CAERE|nr:hypothetical protein CRE_09824 [Caenorhabditis remanei]